jgi:hypothetical protein
LGVIVGKITKNAESNNQPNRKSKGKNQKSKIRRLAMHRSKHI